MADIRKQNDQNKTLSKFHQDVPISANEYLLIVKFSKEPRKEQFPNLARDMRRRMMRFVKQKQYDWKSPNTETSQFYTKEDSRDQSEVLTEVQGMLQKFVTTERDRHAANPIAWLAVQQWGLNFSLAKPLAVGSIGAVKTEKKEAEEKDESLEPKTSTNSGGGASAASNSGAKQVKADPHPDDSKIASTIETICVRFEKLHAEARGSQGRILVTDFRVCFGDAKQQLDSFSNHPKIGEITRIIDKIQLANGQELRNRLKRSIPEGVSELRSFISAK